MSDGGAISWQSQLLTNSSLSTCESEYMQFSSAPTQASFLRQLQMQMVGGELVPYPVRINADNQPALDILHIQFTVAAQSRTWQSITLGEIGC